MIVIAPPNSVVWFEIGWKDGIRGVRTGFGMRLDGKMGSLELGLGSMGTIGCCEVEAGGWMEG